jgi:hypothetical protein
MLKDLASEIRDGPADKSRVDNLLDMNRLGDNPPKRGGAMCARQSTASSANQCGRYQVDGDKFLWRLWITLIEQAVAKLLNAGSHTPARLPVEIDAKHR